MKTLPEIAKKSCLSLEDVIKLEEFILASGYMSPEKARSEIDWFLNKLGLAEYYFKNTSVEEIAKHLIAIRASELVSQFGGEGVGIQLMNEHENRAVYIVEEESAKTEEIENRIEERYPLSRLESYITKEKTGKNFLRLYVVTKPEFKKQPDEGGLSFCEAADRSLLARSDPPRLERYQTAWEAMNNREIPYVAVSLKPETNETRAMIGVHSDRTPNLLTNFSHLFYKYNIYSNRKYREIFSDRKKIYTFYFNRMEAETIEEFLRDLLGVVMLPDHPLTRLFLDEIYSPNQTIYAISAANFAHQFLTVSTQEYSTLKQALADQPEARGILDTLKLQMTKDTYSEERIAHAVLENHELVARIYGHFEARLHPSRRKSEQEVAVLEKELQYGIDTLIPLEQDRVIFRFFLLFNGAVIKTNFFMHDKRCIAYKLSPSFLPRADYAELPFGLFFFVGREFMGFHIRFRDIARGGIRIVKSRHQSQYKQNLNTIFLENYNLAGTQQKKNKDIPEGGAKGTLLLHLGNQEEERSAFISYIDSLLDLLLPEKDVLDREGKKDILFLGPDERTAELMNWAALYARKRKYPFWKAFTTGKAPELGGIPHDMYGMTTVGVHEYLLGVLEKLGLKEEEMVKIQTGGQAGDGGPVRPLPALPRRLFRLHQRQGGDAAGRQLLRQRRGFPQPLPPPAHGRRRPVRALRGPAGGDQHQQLAAAAGREGQTQVQDHHRGRQPVHHRGGQAAPGGAGDHPLQGRLHQQGRGYLLLPGGLRLPGHDGRGVRDEHGGQGGEYLRVPQEIHRGDTAHYP